MPATETPTKSTRAEKREATRARLIDATFECLVEKGYAGTTTALVAERAGTSHGALFNHFGSKEELLLACVSEVFPRFLVEGQEQLLEFVSSAQAGVRRTTEVVDLLWDQFSGDTMRAVRELMSAACTNEALQQPLNELDSGVQAANVQFAAMLVPEMAGRPELPSLVALTLAAVNGAVFSTVAFGDPDRHIATKAILARSIDLLIDDCVES